MNTVTLYLTDLQVSSELGNNWINFHDSWVKIYDRGLGPIELTGLMSKINEIKVINL